jgi:hypothetical protein
MLDPLCKTCGERHRYGPCPQKSLRTPAVKKPVPNDNPEAFAKLDAALEKLDEEKKGLRTPPVQKPAPAKFDKVKYQRELMRKRRAQKRDATTRT